MRIGPQLGAVLIAALPMASPVTALPFSPQGEEESALGYTREYTIQADAAWLEPGKTLAPAYVTIRQGRIARVSTRPPGPRRGPFGAIEPTILKVEGTLAPGMVDAWSRLLPADLLNDRNPLAHAEVADSLPLQRPGADAALAARVGALREQGLAAAYLAAVAGGVQRGVGSAVEFSVHDLPVAYAEGKLEFALSGDRLGAQSAARKLTAAFVDAEAWRESLDDYQEKLTKYEESLEKYHKDLDKYIEEKEKKEAEESSEQAPGRLQEESGDKDKSKEKGKAKPEDKGPKMPTRPKRPVEPRPSTVRNLILDVLDGKRGVRVVADDRSAIEAVIALHDEYDLEPVLVGGAEADLLAEELADAEIPVVLALRADPAVGGQRTLVQRYNTLIEAGVVVALASGGSDGSAAMMLTLAGELIAAGADAEQVWASLTTVPAGLCGLGQRNGRIASGHSGSMILFQGSSPFDASASFRTHKPK